MACIGVAFCGAREGVCTLALMLTADISDPRSAAAQSPEGSTPHQPDGQDLGPSPAGSQVCISTKEYAQIGLKCGVFPAIVVVSISQAITVEYLRKYLLRKQ